MAVRTRAGQAVSELVVAYPWRNSGRAEALAYGLARVLDSVAAGPASVAEMINTEGAALAAAPLGSAPRLIRPEIPVVAITGTNGKTTTARMIGHVARRAGLSVGWSSTDGVYIDGELIEAGDFSGPGGAGRVLRHPGVELAVTETARGGILRRGVGVAYNDVSVVTNISADHLVSTESTLSTSSLRSRRSSPRSPSRMVGVCSTPTTRGRSRCGSAPKPRSGCSPEIPTRLRGVVSSPKAVG